MSDITKKFSLLNNLDNMNENTTRVYYFENAVRLVINNIYMFIPIGSMLKVMIDNGYISFKIVQSQELLFTFEIEYKDLNDFHLFIRGE